MQSVWSPFVNTAPRSSQLAPNALARWRAILEPGHNYKSRRQNARLKRLAHSSARSRRAVSTPIRIQSDNKNKEDVPLVERLFPYETKRSREVPGKDREIPRIPIDSGQVHSASHTKWRKYDPSASLPNDTTHCVLHLRDASNNLTLDDFQRLMPRNQHIKGWTIQPSDLQAVIPVRSPSDLSPQNEYYLHFTSRPAAELYLAHVHHLHQLISKHHTASLISPIGPAPGQLIGGVDVHAAIRAFTLVPPTQRLDLRLMYPASRLAARYLEHGGLPRLKSEAARPERKEWEVRMTLEGRQESVSTIREWVRRVERERGLSWSGVEDVPVVVERYVPPETAGQKRRRVEAGERGASGEGVKVEPYRPGTTPGQTRTPDHVFVLGFETEDAAEGFVLTWHRQPFRLEKGHSKLGEDIPQIINVEML